MTLRIVLLLTLIALVGCGQLPTDADLSSFIHPSAPTAQRRAASRQRENPAARRNRLLAIARQAEETGDVDGAIQQYTRLTKEFPEHADAFHQLAVLYDQHGSPEQSARFYRSALQLAPENTSILCDCGYSRYLSGDLDLAEHTLRRAIELDPTLRRAHNNLALVLARQGKSGQALVSFQNAGQSKQNAEENLRQSQIAARLSATESEAAKSSDR